MKRFILNLVLFLFTSVTTYILLLCFWGDFVPNGILQNNLNFDRSFITEKRFQEAKFTKDVTILFLGSSHTYRGFDTRTFKKIGIKAFNLGSSSQTPIQTEILLHRYLTGLNPKIVIYEVNPEMLSVDGIESSLDIIANDKNDKYSIQLACEQNHIKVYNSVIYGFYTNFIRKKHIQTTTKNYIDTYIPGGYVERKMIGFDSKHFPKLNNLIYNEKQVKHFDNILSMLRNRKINVFLIEAPIHSRAFNSYSNRNDFTKKMRRYGRYSNFNVNNKLNDTIHFYDYQHLNKNGVREFNRRLIDTLKLIYPKTFNHK